MSECVSHSVSAWVTLLLSSLEQNAEDEKDEWDGEGEAADICQRVSEAVSQCVRE